MHGGLQGVHTSGSLYFRNLLLLLAEKPNSDANEPKTFHVNPETARTKKGFLGISLDIRG